MADISKIELENVTYDIKDSTARSDISTINDDITTINGDITTINNKLDLINNKKLVIIGDSYLTGYTPNGTIENWGTKIINKLGLTSSNYTIYGYNSSGFTRTDVKTFATMIDELTEDNTVTDVIVCGGYNDKGASYSDLLYFMTAFKDNCVDKFPNAKIHVGHIGWSKTYTDIYPLHVNIANYKKATEQLGLHYLSNVEYSLKDIYSFLTSDNIHPNNDGQNALANNICNAFLYGSANVDYTFKNITITPATGFTINQYGNFASSVKNGTTSIMMNEIMNISVSPSIDINCDGSHAVEIGTFNAGYICGTQYNTCVMPVTCILGYADGYCTATGTISMNGGKLFLSLYSTNTFNGANAFKTYNGTYLIQIKGCNVAVDSTLC